MGAGRAPIDRPLPQLSPRVWWTSGAAEASPASRRPDGVRTLPVAVPEAVPRALSLVSDGDGELHSVRRSRAATRVKSPRGTALLLPAAVDSDDVPALVTAAAMSAG